MNPPHTYTILETESDLRIDRFLRKYLREAPLSLIFRGLRTGKIKRNGKKSEQQDRLMTGDRITFFYSEEEMSEWRGVETSITGGQDDRMPEDGVTRNTHEKETLHQKSRLEPARILYEDEYLMVVDKPAGVTVHPGDHKTTELSLIDQVQDYLRSRDPSKRGGLFQGALVHRLDRDTSGAILIARDRHTLNHLLIELQSHQIQKVYHTIVVGVPTPPTGTIRDRLLRIEDARDEAKVRVDPSGKEAITHYQTISTHRGGKYTLLSVRIETGRTHQIRVHMASSLGTPILGDRSYGSRGENSHARSRLGITRQMLHAFALTFTHPHTGDRMTIRAPYPEDIQRIIEEE